jgi:drug/metabolite transporter (DMT)-like permease
MKRPLIYAFAYSLIFGFSFLFTKRTLGYVSDVFHLLALRFAVAFILMTVLKMIGVIKISYRGKGITKLLLLAFLQPVLYFTFETLGISLVTSSQAGMMMACIPVFSVMFARIFLKEKTTFKRNVFVIISVTGAMVLSSGDILAGSSTGIIYLLIAVISAGAYIVLSRSISTDRSPVGITYMMMGTGAVVFNLISLIRHITNGEIKYYLNPLTISDSVIGILYLGLLSSVLAFFLVNYTLSRIEVSKAALFANLTTVIAVIAGYFFLKEEIEINQMIGGVMILIGVYGASTAEEQVKK